jgi:hypothetical protein
MGFTITADTYFPVISPEPGKLRRGRRGWCTSWGRIKTSDLKYMAMGIGKGMAKGPVHIYLAGGPGNMKIAVPTDNDRVLKGDCLALLSGFCFGCLFRKNIHPIPLIIPDPVPDPDL